MVPDDTVFVWLMPRGQVRSQLAFVVQAVVDGKPAEQNPLVQVPVPNSSTGPVTPQNCASNVHV
jgi:hypothetical protein